MPAFCDTPTLKEVLIFWCLSLKQQKCPAGPSKPVESYWCIPNLTCTRITIQLWDGWKRLSGVCFHRGVFFHLLMLTLPAAMCERRKLGLQLAAAATTVHLPTATLCICDLSTAYQTGENVLLLQMTANKKKNKKTNPQQIPREQEQLATSVHRVSWTVLLVDQDVERQIEGMWSQGKVGWTNLLDVANATL